MSSCSHALAWCAILLVTCVDGAEYTVDASVLGLPLRSVGAQSTAGTSRLVYDYKEPQRAQLLDLLFKPRFGAAFQHLKVEIGGDAQISCGAEASAMRSANHSEDDFGRGYEHWLMAEAKRRNPQVQLMGLVYAWPSWIDPSGRGSPYSSPTSESNAAQYVSAWVSGVKRAHNLTIDNVGLFNESPYTTSYIKTLRAALDAAGHTTTTIVASDRDWDPIATDYLGDAGVRAAVHALTAHYPSCDATARNCTRRRTPSGAFARARQAQREYGVELWSSEDYSCWSDPLGAARWANNINAQYIGGNITLMSAWHLASAFYSTVAFWNEGMLSATQPWSGNFKASPTLWASAHTTQFTRPGMLYLPQGRGAGVLNAGGSYVSYSDATREQLTIVIETAGAAVVGFCAENCNGECPITAAGAAQNATFLLTAMASLPTTMALRRTRLGAAAVAEEHLFEALPDVPVRAGLDGVGRVDLLVEPDALYTLSTVRGATKAGDVPLNVPASAPFPLPYRDDFDDPRRPLASVGRYWSDMVGAFEIARSRVGAGSGAGAAAGARVLRQSVERAACCPFIPKLNGPLPLTILGSSTWQDVQAQVSVALPADDNASFALLGIRAKFKRGSFFSKGLGLPSGLFLGMDAMGFQVLPSVSDAAGGLTWPCDPNICLAHGLFDAPGRGVWRRLEIGARNRTLTFTVAGAATPVAAVPLPQGVGTGAGFVALATSYGAAVEFDNFTVQAAPAASVASRCDVAPKAGQAVVAVGCGEPAAERGARWEVSSAAQTSSGGGTIALRADPSLCLAAAPVTPRPSSTVSPPPLPLPLASLAQSTAQSIEWRSGTTGHASTVDISDDSKWAAWHAAPGQSGCDGVALAARSAPQYWVQLQAPAGASAAAAAAYVDVGFCSPKVDVSGRTWAGWQSGKAWLYRGHSGLFKGDASVTSQGQPYGATFGVGANVTAIRHNATALEFLLNGASQGLIRLGATEAVPLDVVPCVGTCTNVAAGLESGIAPSMPTPVPTPPPTPRGVVLAACEAGDAAQQWHYDTVAGTITSADSGGVLTWGDGDAGDFVPLYVAPTSLRSTSSDGGDDSDSTRWSPDLGYVHGHSNKPMQCNCMAVCGSGN